jgi:hypothetical protein
MIVEAPKVPRGLAVGKSVGKKKMVGTRESF